MSHYVEREEKKGPSGWRKSEHKFKHSQERFKAQVISFACTQQSRGGEGKISPALLILS